MVLSASVSADGQVAASGSFDGTARLWNTATGMCIATLKGYQGAYAGPIWTVALSADGRSLATGNFDGTLRLWDVASRNLTTVIQAHSGLVWGVSASADGRLVATGGFDGSGELGIRPAACRSPPFRGMLVQYGAWR